MKKIAGFIAILLLTATLSSKIQAQTATIEEYATAESVMIFAEQMDVYDKVALENEINKLSDSEKIRLTQLCYDKAKEARDKGEDVPMGVIYVLAILIPPLAVGLYTDWDTPTLWNLLFTLIGWVPGVVHAFIVITR